MIRKVAILSIIALSYSSAYSIQPDHAIIHQASSFQAQAEHYCSRSDCWTGKDKAQHLLISAAFGIASSAVFEDKWTAFGVAMLPGVAKEIWDYNHRQTHSCSAKDLAADAIGAAIGVNAGHWVFYTSRAKPINSDSVTQYNLAYKVELK